jgi:HlyD family secretion protein
VNRRRILINTGLGALVLALGIGGVVALAAPRQDSTAALPTALAVRGPLAATVTASGNVESGRTAALQFSGTGGGTITKVYVAAGDRVSEGEALVEVDDTATRQQVASAQASLNAAEAAYETATQERTSAERASDSAQVASAEQTLRNAESSLAAALKALKLVESQQAEIVDDATQTVTEAQQAVTDTSATLTQLRAELAATNPADTSAIADLTARISSTENTLATKKAVLASGQPVLTQARRTRDSAIQQAEQTVTSQTGVRDSAQKALAQAKASVKVAQQGPKTGQVDSAQAQIESAEAALRQAKQALADTILRAPFDGTVSTVSAEVGQLTTAALDGLVVLVDPDGLSVSAAIAEADATSVRNGQAATVTLPASSLDLTGKVISIDIASTVTNNVVQYLTRISLDNPPEAVRVGQTASLSIVTGSVEAALSVPTSAIQTDGATRYVTVVTDSGQHRVDVETGLVGTTGTQILSGLSEGDRVLLPSGSTSTLTFPTSQGTSR